MVAMPDGPGVVVLRVDAVPVLRAEGGGLRARLRPEPRAHRADGDGRRLRGQGGRALRARRPGRAAGARHRPRRCASSSRAKRTWRSCPSAIPGASGCARARRGTGTSSPARWTTSSTAAPTRRSRPVVLFRGTVHACGPYRVPNVKVDARAVRTHTVPSGAFRGFGEPQVVFACESQMDLLAERLEMDPLALRRLNALRPGDETITGHKLTTSVGLHGGPRQGGGGLGLGEEARRPSLRHAARCAAASAWPPATTASVSGAHGQAPQPGRRERRRVRGRQRDRGRGHHRDRPGHDHRAQPDHGGGARLSGRDGAR